MNYDIKEIGNYIIFSYDGLEVSAPKKELSAHQLNDDKIIYIENRGKTFLKLLVTDNFTFDGDPSDFFTIKNWLFSNTAGFNSTPGGSGGLEIDVTPINNGNDNGLLFQVGDKLAQTLNIIINDDLGLTINQSADPQAISFEVNAAANGGRVWIDGLGILRLNNSLQMNASPIYLDSNAYLFSNNNQISFASQNGINIGSVSNQTAISVSSTGNVGFSNPNPIYLNHIKAKDGTNTPAILVEHWANSNAIFKACGNGSVYSSGINGNSSNTIYGLNAGVDNNGLGNSCFGSSAGRILNTGDENTVIGFSSGYMLQNGSANTFIGSYAGFYSNAQNNTFIGYNAGYLNSEGGNNVIIGYYAGYSVSNGLGNTLIGARAGSNTDTGQYNTSIGSYSGYHNATGGQNVCIGFFSGTYENDKVTPVNNQNRCIYIGNYSSAKDNSIENEIVIGDNAKGNGPNTATIGDSFLESLFLDGNGSGIVLRTPDGINQYRITIDNAGNLISNPY